MANELEGKVVLLTGGTEGIGKAAALALAQRGASLTLVGRKPEKAAQVVAELKAASGNPRVEPLLGDLSRLAEVRRLAAEFKARHGRLDVLVNNAGAAFRAPLLGPDGYELTFALNHLAYFQLTTALLDLLRSTPGARVVSTSSAMHTVGALDLERTPTSLEGPGWRAYGTSKLCNILFTRELQRRLEGTDASANCFHPGTVRTRFGAFGGDLGPLMNFGYALVRPFARTPEQGADTLVWLASAPEAAALKGQYVSDRRPVAPSRRARDPRLAEALWARSEQLCAEAVARPG